MFGRSDLVQNLKLDILDLKKELASSKEDNQLLKVKIRKLENEVSKRDRQIEILLDPRKSAFVRKVISERGASVLINLRERNLKLEKNLLEKDLLIKRLQNDLQTKKLYTVKDRKRSSSRHSGSNKYDINIPYCEQNVDSDSEKEDDTKFLEQDLKSISMYDISQTMERLCVNSLSTRSNATQHAALTDRTQHSFKVNNKVTNNDLKAQYERLSRSHLLSIIENLKNNQGKLSPRTRCRGSPESDLERHELLCDTPHLEILQLQNYFMDMISEVDQLKATITDLKSDQEKTVRLLKQKGNNTVKLGKDGKSLRRLKSETKSSKVNSLNMYKKRSSHSVANSAKIHLQDYTETRIGAQEAEEENEINVCTYTEAEEPKPQQKENNSQIIQTRTISIQKFEDKSKYTCNQTSTEREFLADIELQNSKDEKETRKKKFKNLLEQMLHKTYTASTGFQDNEFQLEYI